MNSVFEIDLVVFILLLSPKIERATYCSKPFNTEFILVKEASMFLDKKSRQNLSLFI